MSGITRRDIYSRMSSAIATADLVLVLGTSLSGLTADQVAVSAARRSREGRSLGTVVINLQQTPRDGEATLRMFANTDPTFEALLALLGLKMVEESTGRPENIAVVPYNRDGKRSERVRMVVNLNKGTEIRLHPDHNCQGSRQPKLLHVYGRSGGFEPFQVVCRPPGPGNGTVEEYDPVLSGWEITIEGVTLLLGGWWLEAAKRGGPDTLPVINLSPEVGLVGTDGSVRMISEVAEEEREALEAKVVEEEVKDKEQEASKDYTGLIPEMYHATATALLGELESDSDGNNWLMTGTRQKMEERLENARRLVKDAPEREEKTVDDGFVNTVEDSTEEE